MSRQSRHSVRARGRARRRLRHLRRLRELQLRDAGGLVFDLYRFGERREALVRAKFDAIIATDKEIRALEGLLGETGRDRVLELRPPGIGGTCPACGDFHAGDARFCAGCGTPLAEPPVAPPARPAAPQAAPAPAETGVRNELVSGDTAPGEDGSREKAAVGEADSGEEPADAVSEEEVAWTDEAAWTEEVAAQEAAPEVVDEGIVRLGEPAPEEVAAAAPEPMPAQPEVQPQEPEDEPHTDESGEVAAVGPRRARSGSGRPPRRRGSSR
jgi:hypothetical protein